jgi:hypothetical protein
MAADTWRRWNLCAVIVARIFLAAVLLLGAFATAFPLTFRGGFTLSIELFLGAAIAVGWLVRYAAALVLLGTLAANLLAPQFHIALPPKDAWATAFVLLACGILMVCGRCADNPDAAPIHEDNELLTNDPRALSHAPFHEDVEITLRLADGYGGILRRNRCIARIRHREGGIRNTGQETSHARDDR